MHENGALFPNLGGIAPFSGPATSGKPAVYKEDQVIMTGSTTRISKLGYGEIEQFLRDLTEEGFGGNHIRDFRMDKPAFREWVQNGLAILEGQWTTLPAYKPARAWAEIDGTGIWVQHRGDFSFLGEDGALMTTVWFSTVVGGHRSNDRPLSLHPVKWKTIFGVQVRQADAGCIEVRVPAQHDKQIVVDESEEWGPIRRTRLSRGVRVSVGGLFEAVTAEKGHYCPFCQGKADLVVESIGWANDYDREQRQLVHLYGTDWVPLTYQMQIRAVPGVSGAIEMRFRNA